jgi:hypothetical protein
MSERLGGPVVVLVAVLEAGSASTICTTASRAVRHPPSARRRARTERLRRDRHHTGRFVEAFAFAIAVGVALGIVTGLAHAARSSSVATASGLASSLAFLL